MKKIMIIGGYGQVGKYVCEYLHKENQDIIVSGRDLEKCECYVKNVGLSAECRLVDVTK